MSTTGTFILYLWGFGMLAGGIVLWLYVLADWLRCTIGQHNESEAETKISRKLIDSDFTNR